MKLHCMIVDDEPMARKGLQEYCAEVDFLDPVTVCDSPVKAITLLQTQPVQLLFLDIQMPRINGLDLLRSLPQPPLVVLTTAYPEYALQGFELNVIDYLLKPVAFERFMKACNKAHERFLRQPRTPAAAEPAPDHFFVNVEYTLVKVLIADILYVEGLKDYIKIHVASSKKPVITRMSMKAIEEKLPPAQFVRTHKSFIIAAPKITAIKRDLVCLGELELPLSEFYKGNLDKVINR